MFKKKKKLVVAFHTAFCFRSPVALHDVVKRLFAVQLRDVVGRR